MRKLYLTLVGLLFSILTYAVAPITGPTSLCTGSTSTLTDATTGGTWSSADPSIAAIGSSSGMVTGISAGMVTISYTVGSTSVTSIITVNPSPSPITGGSALCAGAAITISDAAAGGIWSSSNPAIATVSASTGMVVGTSIGSTTITYLLATGCYTTTTVTVNPAPSPIVGPSSFCGTATFTNSVGGGIWSSSNVAVISISGTGVAIGTAMGAAIITYSLGSGCTVIKAVSVTATSAITGPASVCTGLTATLSDAVAGGTWSSSNPAIATVGAATGIVTGVTAGAMTITYTSTCGTSTYPMSVTNSVASITGSGIACATSSTTLSDATAGGTWSSSNPSIATIGGSSGVVTAMAAGTATITYSAGGCGSATMPFMVAALPVSFTLSVTGSSHFCAGGTGGHIILSNSQTGINYQLYNGTAAVGASLTGTGTLLDFGAATAGGTYAVMGVNPITGCANNMTGSPVVAVDPIPAVYAITGGGSYCVGGSGVYCGLAYSSTGINYQLYRSGIAVGGAVAGTGTSINFGLQTVGGTYTAIATNTTTTCVANMSGSAIITVNPAPVAYHMTGGGSFCAGGAGVRIGLPFSAAGVNYQLYKDGSPVGTPIPGTGYALDFGLSTASGNYTVWGADAASGCVVHMLDSVIVTALSASCSGTPGAGRASASSFAVCAGSPFFLYLADVSLYCGTAYQWQSSPDGSAWTNIAGATTYTFNHSITATTHYRCTVTCLSSGASATSSPTVVSVRPSIAEQRVIPAADSLCSASHFYIRTCSPGSTYNVTTWYGDGSSDSHALSSGATSTADIYHTYANTGTYRVKQILYSGASAIDSSSFNYDYAFCRTLSLKLFFDANNNCTFDYGEPGITVHVGIVIDSNGTILDTVNVTSGLSYKAYGPVGTVYSFRIISDGLSTVCPSGGVIRDTIKPDVSVYSPKYVGMSCGSAGYDLSVNASLNTGRHNQSGTIIIHNRHCALTPATVTVYHSPRYALSYSYWSPFPTSTTATSITWDLPAISAGDAPIVLYYSTEVSGAWLLPGDTVNTKIIITPTGGDLDTSNNVIQRNDTVISSYDPNEMEVSPKGAILPCTPLEYTIQFENTGNAPAENIAVLDTLPANLDPQSLDIVASSAVMNLAIIKSGGYNIAKFDFPGIHLLDSSHHGQCTGFVIYKIKTRNGLSDGTVIPNRAGIYFDDNEVVMTNSVANTVGINPINGLDSVCTGNSITLTTANAGGLWSASNTHAAMATGLVTGIDPGIDTIRYTMSNACATKTATKIISVNSSPVAGTIIGGNTVCAGSTITLADAAGPGTWSSTNPVVADISASGVVNGLGEGTALIRYTRTNSCGTGIAMTSVTVNPTPVPSVALSGNPGAMIGSGQSDTLIATVANGGPSPSYQWMVNGSPVSGANSSVYISDAFVNNDSVSCNVVSSGDCGGLTTFNSVIIKVAPAGINVVGDAAAIGISPNPNKGYFTIAGTWNTNECITAEITNMLGQTIWTSKLNPIAGKINAQVVPGYQLANGIYILNLKSTTVNRILRFVVEK